MSSLVSSFKWGQFSTKQHNITVASSTPTWSPAPPLPSLPALITAPCLGAAIKNERYDMVNTDIPLIIKYSPYRKVVEPLLKFIGSADYDYQKGDMITVMLPQFIVKSWWTNILHNRTRVAIERELLKHHKHIVVSIMPFQLKGDDRVVKSSEYK